jgi:putative transposase
MAKLSEVRVYWRAPCMPPIRSSAGLSIADGSVARVTGVAKREVLPEVRHRTSRYLNNRAENSHRPTRRRERQMQRFKSPEQAQRFLGAHAFIYGHFRPRRHLMTAAQYRRTRTEAFRVWRRETCVQVAA